jgi:signal transduction histidine kinase
VAGRPVFPSTRRNSTRRASSLPWRLVWLVIIGVVPLLIFNLGNQYLEYRREVTTDGKQTLALARGMALLVDEELRLNVTALQTLAGARSLRDGDLEVFRSRADAVVGRQFPGANILLLRGDGQQLMNTRLPPGAPLPIRPNLESIRQMLGTGEPAVSNVFTDAVSGRPIVAIDVPVTVSDGNLLNVLSLNPRLDVFADTIRRQAFPPDWVISIFDRNGVLVARHPNGDISVGQKVSAGFRSRIIAESEGILESTSREGVPVLSVFSHAGQYGWGVAIGIPRSDLTGPAAASAMRTLAVGGLLCLIGLVLAIHAARRIAAPIATLRRLATEPAGITLSAAPSTGLRETDEVLETLKATQESRRRAEGRLRELQADLIHVSRLNDLGQMVSALAHEVNQPLAAMGNYINGARRLFAAGNLSGGQQAIEMVAEQSKRAREIIRRLRDLAKKSDSKRKPESLSTTIEEAAAFALVGVEHGLTVDIQVERDANDVIIDKIQIQQVLINLIRNAAESMSTATRRELKISARRMSEMIEVQVADTGPGLSQEVRNRLFQPFVTTKSDGMGVGLSVCRAIIEAHGGAIHADEAASEGTAFRFTVPRARSLVLAGTS